MSRETLDQLLENTKDLNPGEYWVSGLIMLELCAKHNGKAIDAFCDIYRIGFLKGQRAERARRKKAVQYSKQYMENDTYYSFDSSGEIIEIMHENNMWDIMVVALGIGFDTPEDAKEHEGEVLRKLGLAEWPERRGDN